MTSDSEQCSCCSHKAEQPSTYQTLDEMDFERGIWSAAKDGELDRVRKFVQKGTDPNLRDLSNFTALHYASRNGQLTVCKLLLESGACASPQTPGGATPLHRAAYCGHLDVVRLLLDHGADPRLCDDDGATALHKAAGRGQEEVCKLLLQHCPSLQSQVNKKLQLPYQLLQEGHHLQDLLKPTPNTFDYQSS